MKYLKPMPTEHDNPPQTEAATPMTETLQNLRYELKKVIVGQDALLERLLIALIANGHLLVEGTPGLAKTLALKTLAHVVQLPFSRIQFTADLLPSDLTGTRIFHADTGTFSTEQGPVFASLVLADEINRAPAKVQSALLEAMEERQVTIGTTTHPLPSPFLVMATQNPLESEGTYPLPDAQLDRFLLHVPLGYPSAADELEILNRTLATEKPVLQPMLSATALQQLQTLCQQVYVDPCHNQQIVAWVQATRQHPYLWSGASPRGSLALLRCSQARAVLYGRTYVIEEDLFTLMDDCLRHRVVINHAAKVQGHTIADILRTMRLPSDG
jgi:MoxR-like ATPase